MLIRIPQLSLSLLMRASALQPGAAQIESKTSRWIFFLLAAMSSSWYDVSLSVFVRSSFRPTFFLLLSLEFLLVLKSFNGVLRLFKEYLKLNEVSRMFPGSLKDVSRKFQECFTEVSGKFHGCFKKVSRMFQLRLKGISGKFQRYFKDVSRVFQESF